MIQPEIQFECPRCRSQEIRWNEHEIFCPECHYTTPREHHINWWPCPSCGQERRSNCICPSCGHIPKPPRPFTPTKKISLKVRVGIIPFCFDIYEWKQITLPQDEIWEDGDKIDYDKFLKLESRYKSLKEGNPHGET